MTCIDIEQAKQLLLKGEVIAYPTEAVYGLGCDPWCEKSVRKILSLKQRPESKGVIVLIASFEQLWPLIDLAQISEESLEQVKRTWPGAVTWIFPKSDIIPQWISGEHTGIAIRMTAHPVARELCKEHPVVSTSANFAGEPPLCSVQAVQAAFGHYIAGVVSGDLGTAQSVSAIYDVLSGEQLR